MSAQMEDSKKLDHVSQLRACTAETAFDAKYRLLQASSPLKVIITWF